MHDLKRSKKKMYKKQMPAMINSYNEESTVEIEDLERGCKNKTNVQETNLQIKIITTIKNTTVITIIMNTMTMMNLNAFVNVKNQTTTVNLVKLNQILV